MRQLTSSTFLSLDGVMQAPGGPEEDASNGFSHGGWLAPYFDDVVGQAMGAYMDKTIDLVLGKTGMSVHDVSLYVLHQANIRIINAATDRLGIPRDRVFNNLERYGNTSGGSIPIALDEAFLRAEVAPQSQRLEYQPAETVPLDAPEQGDLGLAETIDRLHGIAHEEQAAAVTGAPSGRQPCEQVELRVGGVLELVDEEVLDALVER